jgi:Tfp pilus assembly protein PilF
MSKDVFRRPVFHLILITVLGLLVYSNTFDAPFQFDDISIVVNNQAAKEFDQSVFMLRQVGYFSFALNYKAHGFDVRGYHAVNLLVHILSAVLLYLLVRLTFRTPLMADSSLREKSGHVALLSGLLFVCHPVQTQAVTYIVQRFASLSAMFYLASLVLYVRYRIGTIVRSTTGTDSSREFGVRRKTASVLLYLASLLCALLAMKTKEMAFTLPLAIVMYELMFFRGGFKSRLLHLGPLFLTILIIPLTLFSLNVSLGDVLERITEATRMQTGMSRLEYLFTEFRVITTYVRLLFLPVGQNLDYDYPMYGSLFEPRVFLSFMFLLGIFGLGVYMLRRSRTAAAGRLAAFGVFWFFLTLSVESSIVPIVDVIFEHRVYLPSAGVFVAVAAGVCLLSNRLSGVWTKAVAGILVTVVVALSGAAYARNNVWRSEISLWEDVVGKSPRKARPHNNLGKAYNEAEMVERAIEHLKRAISLDPELYKAYNNLGNALRAKGLIDRAIREYRICLGLRPDYAEAHNNLGNALRAKGLLDMAEEELKEALRLKPDSAESHNNLGIIYRAKGMTDKALDHYDEALRIRPDYAEAHNNLAVLYAYDGFRKRAIGHYLEAIKLRQDFADAHYNLATAYRDEGMIPEASEHYQRAIILKPALRNTP